MTPEGMAAMAAAVVLVLRELERLIDRVLRHRGKRRTRRGDPLPGPESVHTNTRSHAT